MNATAERRIKNDVPRQYHAMYRKVQSGKATRGLALKIMCLECMGWEKGEVRKCVSEACPLHRFRPFQPNAGSASDSKVKSTPVLGVLPGSRTN